MGWCDYDVLFIIKMVYFIILLRVFNISIFFVCCIENLKVVGLGFWVVFIVVMLECLKDFYEKKFLYSKNYRLIINIKIFFILFILINIMMIKCIYILIMMIKKWF